ncbi:MAG: urease accessory protein UreE [Desulfovibrio sp.]|jgi:urease accessory protein|nr:urease accessory protein UreE [Desulfovibrio sp.]
MLEFIRNLGQRPDLEAGERLPLDYAARCKARQRALLESGREAGLFLERGRMLAEGDVLVAADDTLALVLCKPEEVTSAVAGDWRLLARGCYHLGNRHTPAQIGNLWLRIQPDPVLEAMLERLGFSLRRETAPFVPEGGAYAPGLPQAHSHGHSLIRSHSRAHSLADEGGA